MNHQLKNLAFHGENVPIFPARPFQIVTLLDMLQFYAYVFYLFINKFDVMACDLQVWINKRGMNSEMKPEELDAVRFEMTNLQEELENAGVVISLETTAKRMKEIRETCNDDYPPPVLGEIAKQIRRLRKDLEEDLKAKVFMALSAEDVGYYHQEQGFGPEVFTNFPSGQYDVAEAGNCYATGRYTACVFHCTRVVEKGLQTLALNLNSRFGADVSFGDKDIRFVNWGNILEKIEKEIGKLLHPGRKPRILPEDLDFYSNAAKEFVYMKILWRDPVTHSRSKYDEPMAQSVMTHVKLFMKHLAENGLTETLITTDNKAL